MAPSDNASLYGPIYWPNSYAQGVELDEEAVQAEQRRYLQEVEEERRRQWEVREHPEYEITLDDASEPPQPAMWTTGTTGTTGTDELRVSTELSRDTAIEELKKEIKRLKKRVAAIDCNDRDFGCFMEERHNTEEGRCEKACEQLFTTENITMAQAAMRAQLNVDMAPLWVGSYGSAA